MTKNEKIHFDKHYQQLLKCLKLQGKADKTIDSYSRAIRRVVQHFDYLPEALTPDNLKDYFAALVESHSWSTVKIDRLGLQFYWRHILKKDWQWIDIVKPPKVKTLPDILTPSEIERLIAATRKLRYRVFLLTCYSMGLRLEETLSLQVSDIDTERQLVHIRRGKGHKDRLVPLPVLTLKALRVKSWGSGLKVMGVIKSWGSGLVFCLNYSTYPRVMQIVIIAYFFQAIPATFVRF